MRRLLARGVAHALLLAMLVLAVIPGGLLPSSVTAQVTEPLPTPSSSPVPGATVPGDVRLHVGQTATLDDGALQVTLAGVVEDSRCPMDVMCVWMGRAVATLHVAVDGVDRGEVMVTHYHGPHSQSRPELHATVDRYVLVLTDLQPYPRASQPQQLDQRVATIHVAPAAP